LIPIRFNDGGSNSKGDFGSLILLVTLEELGRV
jgi:hypothetical protein